MNFAQKTRAVALGGLIAILLAGCAGSPSGGAHATADGATSTSSSGAQAQPEPRKVRVLKVIDPMTVVVTPTTDSDTLHGKNFTVHVNDIVTPAKAQCGYEDALALSAATLVGHTWILRYEGVTDGTYIDKHGDHYGSLDSLGLPYAQTMISKGMALESTHTKYPLNKDVQAQAKADGVGLYSSCAGFGA